MKVNIMMNLKKAVTIVVVFSLVFCSCGKEIPDRINNYATARVKKKPMKNVKKDRDKINSFFSPKADEMEIKCTSDKIYGYHEILELDTDATEALGAEDGGKVIKDALRSAKHTDRHPECRPETYNEKKCNLTQDKYIKKGEAKQFLLSTCPTVYNNYKPHSTFLHDDKSLDDAGDWCKTLRLDGNCMNEASEEEIDKALENITDEAEVAERLCGTYPDHSHREIYKEMVVQKINELHEKAKKARKTGSKAEAKEYEYEVELAEKYNDTININDSITICEIAGELDKKAKTGDADAIHEAEVARKFCKTWHAPTPKSITICEIAGELEKELELEKPVLIKKYCKTWYPKKAVERCKGVPERYDEYKKERKASKEEIEFCNDWRINTGTYGPCEKAIELKKRIAEATDAKKDDIDNATVAEKVCSADNNKPGTSALCNDIYIEIKKAKVARKFCKDWPNNESITICKKAAEYVSVKEKAITAAKELKNRINRK
ncbi:MAG: hypothetical protein LE168_00020 [Endomicrobium sp.]|nr:hypothetical protein [Endomicrobium sp.]